MNTKNKNNIETEKKNTGEKVVKKVVKKKSKNKKKHFFWDSICKLYI